MKKTILLVLTISFILGAGVFAVSFFLGSANQITPGIEVKERDEKHVRTIVAKMVKDSDAVADWTDKLSRGKRVRVQKILVSELEKLWIGNRPILFTGSIDNIAAIDDRNYSILIQRGLSSSYGTIFTTDLALNLECAKGDIDQLLEQHPELFEKYGVNNGVAVIAKVVSVKTLSVYNPKGEKTELKIGSGECVDILYTGNVRF